jgi:hypothetical protein
MIRMYPSAQLALAVILLAATIGCDRSSPLRRSPPPPTPSGPATAAWITTKIQARYFTSPDLKLVNIDVMTTSDGHVTLRGAVAHERHRDAAVRIAEETDGVTAVDDLLQAPGPSATVSRAGRGKRPPRSETGGPRVERPDLSVTTRIQAKFSTDAARLTPAPGGAGPSRSRATPKACARINGQRIRHIGPKDTGFPGLLVQRGRR